MTIKRFTVAVKCFVIALLLLQHVSGSLIEFHHMIESSSSLSSWDFLGYGNHCGLGGSGSTVDAIDECCRQHDSCVGQANRGPCLLTFYLGFFTIYYHWYFSNDGLICGQQNWECAQALCQCDKAAAECFANNEHVYNIRNKNSGVIQLG